MAGEIIKAYFGIVAISIVIALFAPILMAIATGLFDYFKALKPYFGLIASIFAIVVTLGYFGYKEYTKQITQKGLAEIEEVGYSFNAERCLNLEKPAYGNYCQDAVDYLRKQGRYDEVKTLELGFYRQKCLRFEEDCDKARYLLNQQ